MPILAWLLKQISGPLLLPAVLVGLMTTGGLLLKARDARTTALCDARWEREIRRQEQDAAASRIRAAEEQAENSSRAVERLTNERDKALQKSLKFRLSMAAILAVSMTGCSTLSSLKREDGAPMFQKSNVDPLPEPPEPLRSCMQRAGFKPPKQKTAQALVKALAAENAELKVCLKAWPDWYYGVRQAALGKPSAKPSS